MHEVVEDITASLLEKTVVDWKKVLDESDYEHEYFKPFGALACNIVNLIFPAMVTRGIIYVAAKVILPDAATKFIMNDYLPVLQDATKDVHIPISEKFNFLQRAMGFIYKILYAFLY